MEKTSNKKPIYNKRKRSYEKEKKEFNETIDNFSKYLYDLNQKVKIREKFDSIIKEVFVKLRYDYVIHEIDQVDDERRAIIVQAEYRIEKGFFKRIIKMEHTFIKR